MIPRIVCCDGVRKQIYVNEKQTYIVTTTKIASRYLLTYPVLYSIFTKRKSPHYFRQVAYLPQYAGIPQATHGANARGKYPVNGTVVLQYAFLKINLRCFLFIRRAVLTNEKRKGVVCAIWSRIRTNCRNIKDNVVLL